MTSIQLLSDIHFERHRDGGAGFISSLNPEGVDVLVLAGDIVTAYSMDSLRKLCELYRDSTVIWVHGNHTFYGSQRARIIDASWEIEGKCPNLVWLDNSLHEVGGRRFVGTPLWFPANTDTAIYGRNWKEFEVIPQWTGWVYMENYDAVQYLEKTVREGDIVVSHYLPSFASISERYKSSVNNCFFVCDQSELICDRKPALWLHGHTHDSCDYYINKTRIVCNPFGYNEVSTNTHFKDNLVIEV